MSEQAIPDDILDTAHDVAFDCDPSKSADQIADNIARALLAERRKHDHPTSPDLQAEAERVFAEPKLDTTHPAALAGARALRDTGMETNQIARAIKVFEAMTAAIREAR